MTNSFTSFKVGIMNAAEFYQTHLDRVSRSFAFCIRQLPDPLHEWIALSYLLCRVVDTIEDSAWESSARQFEAFKKFDESLLDPAKVSALEAWANDFPSDVSEGEKLLLEDSIPLLKAFHEFPPAVHEIIGELVLSMSRGMQHFCQQRRDGTLRLNSLSEVNQYCFFVAGVVGELLAKLVSRVEPKFKISQLSLLRAHHFGLFLQKVNLLKDQVGDEKLGRHLIPSREAVEESSRENAVEALGFLLDVPKEQLEFRRFCAWSLFLGLEALRVARDSILKQKVLKVPRADAEALLMKVEDAIGDDGALRQLFEHCLSRLGWSLKLGPGAQESQIPQWFRAIYPGLLESPYLLKLGL